MQQDCKFVAAQPGYDVTASDVLGQQVRNPLQQFIAGMVPAGIIDDLELVDVDIQEDVCDLLLCGGFQGEV